MMYFQSHKPFLASRTSKSIPFHFIIIPLTKTDLGLHRVSHPILSPVPKTWTSSTCSGNMHISDLLQKTCDKLRESWWKIDRCAKIDDLVLHHHLGKIFAFCETECTSLVTSFSAEKFRWWWSHTCPFSNWNLLDLYIVFYDNDILVLRRYSWLSFVIDSAIVLRCYLMTTSSTPYPSVEHYKLVVRQDTSEITVKHRYKNLGGTSVMKQLTASCWIWIWRW